MKLSPSQSDVVRELLGYLNFSGGRPDARFQKHLNELSTWFPSHSWEAQHRLLLEELTQLNAAGTTGFENVDQARAVLDLTFTDLYQAYREHHQDLLFHLPDDELEIPFFLARLFEAVLEQGAPWTETGRIVQRSLQKLNDFLGYRPIAVLENGRRNDPYGHERFRPLPWYIKGAGVSHGKYEEVIERTLSLLREAPPNILSDAYFELELVDELAIDPRAHDHMHPANKRTNYLFGEWDPHLIDVQGRYRRFIIRRVILEALLQWMSEQKRVPAEEVLYDAAAVLSGTILMASSISGSGPETHDSNVTLTSLLPRVARQRDLFYAMLLETATGARKKRLEKHAKATQQPFGHVRQYLNMFLAQYGTQQVQRRHLAYLFARMGYADAARRQALVIPAAAARFESEIQWRFTAFRRHLERGELEEGLARVEEIEQLLYRGIECGAIVDPWNILGFQGHFPLFSSREDSVPDQRVEALLHLVELILEAYSVSLQEASARGLTEMADSIRTRFGRFADWWDKFGTTTVSEFDPVSGRASFESASHVASTLAQWREAGEAAGDISFWRRHSDQFESSKGYAQVVEALLERRDTVASMGLLMQWLSQADDESLEAGPHSFFVLMTEWLEVALEGPDETRQPQWPQILRMFDYLEANAGDYWHVPRLSQALSELSSEPAAIDEGDKATDGGEDDVFSAAYEGVTYRDTTDDGFEGETVDGTTSWSGQPGEFELIERLLEPRLKFARMVIQLWQVVASEYALSLSRDEKIDEGVEKPTPAISADYIEGWLQQSQQLQERLQGLMNDVWNHAVAESSGEHDANIELDTQLQTKFFLLQTIVVIQTSCRAAQWCLASLLPAESSDAVVAPGDRLFVAVYRGVMRRDAHELRKLLPQLLRELQRKPLLYVPLEHGGAPEQVLSARVAQALIRFLLIHLPQLGLIRETWHLLRTAHEMERSSRPSGMAVTEFDRLFRIALRSSLESVVDASRNWRSGKFSDEDLIEVVGSIVEHYLDQWLEHSSTMRLSTIEALKMDGVWKETRDFIKSYGADLLHARNLTLGNLRAILHQGIDKFFDYLIENEDPLHPMALLEDIRGQKITRRHAEETLRLIYQMVVDRFERFLEYNTTTTQSDYGNMFYSLLDFLRVEISYERDAWNLLPVSIAHEVLARKGRAEAAEIWEEVFSMKTEDMADRHLAELAKLEKTHGMRLPSITNHLSERFVKPLAVNNMLALIPPAVKNSTERAEKSPEFEKLEASVEEYLENTSGSGLEIPAWLRSLEEELNNGISSGNWTRGDAEPELNLPAPTFNLREMRSQLKQWKQPLTPPKKPRP